MIINIIKEGMPLGAIYVTVSRINKFFRKFFKDINDEKFDGFFGINIIYVIEAITD